MPSSPSSINRWLLLLLGLVLTAPALRAQDQDDPEATEEGRSSYLGREIARTMHWTGAPWLLRETREDEENGQLLREWLELKPGRAVCDFGCGNGYHTLPIAKMLGDQGKVYAVDLQVPMLAMLRERLAEADLTNVELIEATLDDPRLPADSCDLILMVDVYHELSHPVRILQHVRRALKPGGRLVLVEFRAEDPKVPIKAKHKMSKAQVVREMAANGFRAAGNFDGLPWQHVMAFTVEEDPGPYFEEDEFLHSFWNAVEAADPMAVSGFLAESVHLGPGLRGRTDALEDYRELIGDVGTERWAELYQGWRRSRAADGNLLLRKDGRRQRVRALRNASGVLEVVDWWSRPKANIGPLVAMNTGTGRGTPEEQVALIGELSYAGIGWGIWHTAEVRAFCEARGMDLWSVYVVLDVAKDPDPREEQLAKAIAALAGGPGQVWLALESSEHTVSDPAGDVSARRTLKRVMAMADAAGAEVALYPHYRSWLERSEDALRLVAAVDDPNLGLCFNLCHWLRNHGDADPAETLRGAADKLFAVTLNGADRAGTDWSQLIQPLDAGDYDLARFLSVLEALKFDGPIGLQGYGIQLAAQEHLSRSMKKWLELRGQ